MRTSSSSEELGHLLSQIRTFFGLKVYLCLIGVVVVVSDVVGGVVVDSPIGNNSQPSNDI